MLKSAKLFFPIAGGLLLSSFMLYKFLRNNKDNDEDNDDEPHHN